MSDNKPIPVMSPEDLPDDIREIFKDALALGVPASLIMATVNEINTEGEEDDEETPVREAWIGPEPPMLLTPRGPVRDDVYSVLMEARRRVRPDREKRVGTRASAVYPGLAGFTVPCVGPGEVYVLAVVDDHNADLLRSHPSEAFIHQWIAGRDLDALLLRFQGTAGTLNERARFVLGIAHARADLGADSIRAVAMQPVDNAAVSPRELRVIFGLDGRVYWQKR